ncbi:unnamed protein product [Malus baccata var. baccata]
MASSLLHVLVILLGFSHLVFLNAIPATRIGSLNHGPQLHQIAGSNKLVTTEKSYKEQAITERMDVELHDYPGSGANNRHTPRPQYKIEGSSVDQADCFAKVSVQSLHELLQLVSEIKNAKILPKLLEDRTKCVENLVELERIREANKVLVKEDRDVKVKKPEIQKTDVERKRPAEKKLELQKKDGREKASEARKKMIPCPRCFSLRTKFHSFSNYNLSKDKRICRDCKRLDCWLDCTTSYPSGDGAMAGKPNFFMSSVAISSFALSDGWYSSQNTYLLLSLHSTDAGTHVKAGRILPNEQHGESALLNPAMAATYKVATGFIQNPTTSRGVVHSVFEYHVLV